MEKGHTSASRISTKRAPPAKNSPNADHIVLQCVGEKNNGVETLFIVLHAEPDGATTGNIYDPRTLLQHTNRWNASC